jgi:lysophospholipase L1-like esterase
MKFKLLITLSLLLSFVGCDKNLSFKRKFDPKIEKQNPIQAIYEIRLDSVNEVVLGDAALLGNTVLTVPDRLAQFLEFSFDGSVHKASILATAPDKEAIVYSTINGKMMAFVFPGSDASLAGGINIEVPQGVSQWVKVPVSGNGVVSVTQGGSSVLMNGNYMFVSSTNKGSFDVSVDGSSVGSFTIAKTYVSAVFEDRTNKEILNDLLSNMSDNAMKVVWVGDSITEQGNGTPGKITGFTTFIENKYPGANYVNHGVGGHTTKDTLAMIDTIAAEDADLYFIAIGINDARYNDARGATNKTDYLDNIDQIVSRLAQDGAEVVIASIWPSYWDDLYSALGRELTDARYLDWNSGLEQYGQDYGYLYIDSHTGIRSYVNKYNVESLVPDGVHPDYTGTEAKRLYADCVLYDSIVGNQYGPIINYYKLVAQGTMSTEPSKYVGFRNINSPNTVLHPGIHDSSNVYSYEGLFGDITAPYGGFYNGSSQFPTSMTFASEGVPTALEVTGLVAGNGISREMNTYELYLSDNPASIDDINHSSWVKINEETSDKGTAVDILPRNTRGKFYMLYMHDLVDPLPASSPDIFLRKIADNHVPIRVAIQNVQNSNPRKYAELFRSGIVDADTVNGLHYHYAIMWEASEDLTQLDILSDNTIGSWTLKETTNELAFGDPVHAAWTDNTSGSGDGVFPVN